MLGVTLSDSARMLKNMVTLGVSFMVHFTAVLGATHLQSSINKAGGVGTAALAAQYAALVASSLFLSVFLIRRIGCKWTMAASILCYVPYMGAQLYPRTYTLVPTALLMGLAAAPLWSAKCTYLCVVADVYSRASGANLKTARDRIIGSFFMIFLFSMVWGNLISSLVLNSGTSNVSANASSELLHCGADYCPASGETESNPNLVRPDEEKIRTIMFIYMGCIVLAALIILIGVDQHERYEQKSVWSQVTATLRLHLDRRMLLILPISLWLGIDYAFVEAEYSAAFVACAWGISQIGYVIVVYGLLNSAGALVTGWLMEKVGSLVLVCAVGVAHLAVMVGTLLWRPAASHTALYFVIAGLLGAADGHWAVQINALYAIVFPGNEDAAYSNFRLWQSLGFVVAFAYSHYLCIAAKIYVIMALLVVGVAAWMGLEFGVLRKAALPGKV